MESGPDTSNKIPIASTEVLGLRSRLGSNFGEFLRRRLGGIPGGNFIKNKEVGIDQILAVQPRDSVPTVNDLNVTRELKIGETSLILGNDYINFNKVPALYINSSDIIQSQGGDFRTTRPVLTMKKDGAIGLSNNYPQEIVHIGNGSLAKYAARFQGSRMSGQVEVNNQGLSLSAFKSDRDIITSPITINPDGAVLMKAICLEDNCATKLCPVGNQEVYVLYKGRGGDIDDCPSVGLGGGGDTHSFNLSTVFEGSHNNRNRPKYDNAILGRITIYADQKDIKIVSFRIKFQGTALPDGQKLKNIKLVDVEDMSVSWHGLDATECSTITKACLASFVFAQPMQIPKGDFVQFYLTVDPRSLYDNSGLDSLSFALTANASVGSEKVFDFFSFK